MNTYVIDNPPDLSDLKTKLKFKRIFEGDRRWCDFERAYRFYDRQDEPFCCDLTDSEVEAIKSFGCKVKEYVYECDCGYCESCRSKRLEELMGSISDDEKAQIEDLRDMMSEVLAGVSELSDNAQAVWNFMYAPRAPVACS